MQQKENVYEKQIQDKYYEQISWNYVVAQKIEIEVRLTYCTRIKCAIKRKH